MVDSELRGDLTDAAAAVEHQLHGSLLELFGVLAPSPHPGPGVDRPVPVAVGGARARPSGPPRSREGMSAAEQRRDESPARPPGRRVAIDTRPGVRDTCVGDGSDGLDAGVEDLPSGGGSPQHQAQDEDGDGVDPLRWTP